MDFKNLDRNKKLNGLCITPGVLLMLGLLIFASLLSALVPPFQSPDEQDHLKRAYLLSRGQLLMQTPDGQSTGGMIDKNLNRYMAINLYLASHPDRKMTAERELLARGLNWTGDETFNGCPGVSYYFPLIYTPQAIALGIGRGLNLSIDQSYYLARLLTCLTGLILIFISFRSFRPSCLVICLLLTPMVLFQWIATSQDGIALALCVFCASRFLLLMNSSSDEQKLNAYLLVLGLFVLINARTNLLPLLALPFVLALKFPQRKYLLLNAIVLVLLSIIWMLVAMRTTTDLRINIGAKPAEILAYYIMHPWEFFRVLFNTLSNGQLLAEYANSFVGVLGWMDTSIGRPGVKAIWIALVAALLGSFVPIKLNRSNTAQWILLIAALLSILLTFFLLLITWTPHPADQIQGVQGRYLWCPAILAALALTQAKANLSVWQKILMIVALAIVVWVSFVKTPRVLLDRYYLLANEPVVATAQHSPLERATKRKEITAVIAPIVNDQNIVWGGYVDMLKATPTKAVLYGWGYFTGEEKSFLSNKSESINFSYVAIERPDVVRNLGNKQMILSGFQLTIEAENPKALLSFFDGLCLFTQDKVLGKRVLKPSSSSAIYQCKRQ